MVIIIVSLIIGLLINKNNSKDLSSNGSITNKDNNSNNEIMKEDNNNDLYSENMILMTLDGDVLKTKKVKKGYIQHH